MRADNKKLDHVRKRRNRGRHALAPGMRCQCGKCSEVFPPGGEYLVWTYRIPSMPVPGFYYFMPGHAPAYAGGVS
jgi:hypothetical protein